MAEKRYYWLKLKEDFFDNEAIDWIEEQPNGAIYALFYLKLCLKSLKTDGILIRNVGDMLIPYDANKLAEITKTDIDTVKVAMDLLNKTGLVQILENGEIYMTQLETMVGSETDWAKKKRLYRERQANLLSYTKENEDNVLDVSGRNPIREKSIEYREKSIDKKEINKEKRKTTFKPPTIEEVEAYCKERNNTVNAEAFIDFYESKGWYIGKNKMKNWKAAVRTWEKNNKPIAEQKTREEWDWLND